MKGHQGEYRLLPLHIPGVQALLEGKLITRRLRVSSQLSSNMMRKYQNPKALRFSSDYLGLPDLYKLLQKCSKCHVFFPLDSKISGRCLSRCCDSYNSYLTINQCVKMSRREKWSNLLKIIASR